MKLLSIICSIFFVSGALLAEPTKPADFKLGVVDFQKALNGVEEGKTAKSKLKTEFESKQKDLESRKKKLDGLQAEIQDLQGKAQSGLLKPEAMEKGLKLEADFRKEFEEYTKLVEKHQKDISEKEMKATQDIIAKLRDLVVDLGRKEGFSMVLESNQSGLVYAATYTDLTEKLIQTYNGAHKGK